MIKRALLSILVAGAILAACGPAPKPASETEICGPQGCDGCVGFNCSRSADGGVQ